MRGLVLQVGDRRLSWDERSGRNVPGGLRFASSWNGGFTTLSCPLLRDVRDAANEEQPDEAVAVFTDGGAKTRFAGRLEGLPRTVTRRRMQVQADAVGLCALLEDREDLRFLGIDRASSGWQPSSMQRRINLTAASRKQFDPKVQMGTVSVGWDGYVWGSVIPMCEAAYFSGPVNIGRVVGDWRSTGLQDIANNRSFFLFNFFGPDRDVSSASYVSGNLNATQAVGATVPFSSVAPAGARLAGLEMHYPSAGGGNDLSWYVSFQNLAVLGDHGLTLTGSGASNYGLKFSDAAAYWIRKWFPDLTVGTVVDSVVGIQHMAMLDPTTGGELLRTANQFHGWAWGVWEGGRFDLHPFGEGAARTWYVRASDPGVSLQLEGVKRSQLYTAVVVGWTDPSGAKYTVGPSGTIADVYDESLRLTDPTHPLVKAGSERVKYFDLGVPADQTLATYVGVNLLSQLNAARRSGTITIQGRVVDEFGTPALPLDVRGGDAIVVTDRGDSSPRRVMTAEFDASSNTVTATVDNTLQTVEALLAHLGARATGRL